MIGLAVTDRKQVLCSVVKWCWSRLQGGVVSWEAYELFKVGESGTEISFSTSRLLLITSQTRIWLETHLRLLYP